MDPSKSLPPPPSPSKPPTRWLKVLFNLVLLSVLIGALGIGASLHNQKKLRINIANGRLVVEQGKLFPIGFVEIKTDTDSKSKAYAPIPLRDTMRVDVPIEFSDRTELDQYLFSLLSAWSKELIESGVRGDVALAETLIERSELIPGVSVQQRREIRSMKADLSFSAAKRMVLQAQETLKAAERELRDASSVESRFESDAVKWLRWTQHTLQLFESGPELPDVNAPNTPPKQIPVQDLPQPGTSDLNLGQGSKREESGNSPPKQENTVQSKPQSFDL